MDQMNLNERNEAKAKEMYLSGTRDPETIAQRLNCSVQHVKNWIKWGNWEKLV